MKTFPEITHAGQKWYDEPIRVFPKRKGLVEISVAKVIDPDWHPPSPIVVRRERVELRWMKPDGKGGLVPE